MISRVLKVYLTACQQVRLTHVAIVAQLASSLQLNVSRLVEVQGYKDHLRTLVCDVEQTADIC